MGVYRNQGQTKAIGTWSQNKISQITSRYFPTLLYFRSIYYYIMFEISQQHKWIGVWSPPVYDEEVYKVNRVLRDFEDCRDYYWKEPMIFVNVCIGLLIAETLLHPLMSF